MLEFQKTKSRFGIRILEILGVAIFTESGEFDIFGPKFAQKWNLGSEIQKSKCEFLFSNLEILCELVFSQSN